MQYMPYTNQPNRVKTMKARDTRTLRDLVIEQIDYLKECGEEVTFGTLAKNLYEDRPVKNGFDCEEILHNSDISVHSAIKTYIDNYEYGFAELCIEDVLVHTLFIYAEEQLQYIVQEVEG